MNALFLRVGDSLHNRYLIGGFVLLVVLLTLALDVTGQVFPCPYCRVQRFSLGILSLILLSKWHGALLSRYLAVLIGGYGLIVGITQNFNHVKMMNAAEFDWSAVHIGHPWVLSGFAVIALVWLLFLIMGVTRSNREQGAS